MASWHQVIANDTYVDPILDGLVHNAHRLELAGEACAEAAPHRLDQGHRHTDINASTAPIRGAGSFRNRGAGSSEQALEWPVMARRTLSGRRSATAADILIDRLALTRSLSGSPSSAPIIC